MTAKSNKQTPQVRAHIFYVGRVQGVGFRYTAEKIALELSLTGWVKNLPDGRVEIVCEGPKEIIERLLADVQNSHLGKHVRSVTCEWGRATREFKDFQVEFCY